MPAKQPWRIWLNKQHTKYAFTWWRHQMETFSALLAICAGNSPVPGEFPTQRPVTRSFDVYFDLRPNKRLSKQSWSWWFETLSPPLWRHGNDDAAKTEHNTAKPCVLCMSYWIHCHDDVTVIVSFNTLAPGRFKRNFRYVIFKLISVIVGWGISCEIAFRWIHWT